MNPTHGDERREGMGIGGMPGGFGSATTGTTTGATPATTGATATSTSPTSGGGLLNKVKDFLSPSTGPGVGSTDPAVSGAGTHAGTGMTGAHGTHGPGTATDKIVDKVTPGQNTYGSTDPMRSAMTGQHGLPGTDGRHGPTVGGSGLTGSHTTGSGLTGAHGPGTAADRAIDKVTPGSNTYGSTDPMHSGSAVTGKHGLPGSEGKSAAGMMGAGTHGTGMTGSHGPGTTTDKVIDKVTPGQNTYGSTDPMHSGSAVTGKHGLPGSEGKSATGMMGSTGTHGTHGTYGPGTTTDRMMDKVTPGTNTYGSTDPMHSGSAVTGQHGLPGSEGRDGHGTGSALGAGALGAGAGGLAGHQYGQHHNSGVTGTHTSGMTGSHGPGTTTDKVIDKVTPGQNTYGSTDPMHSGSAVTGQRGIPGSEGSHHHGAGTALGTGAAGAGAGALGAHQYNQHHGSGVTGSHGPGTTGDKILDKVTPGKNTYGSTDPMHSGSAVTGKHGAPGSEGHRAGGVGFAGTGTSPTSSTHTGDISALPATERSPDDGSVPAQAVRQEGMTAEDAKMQQAFDKMGISKEEFRHEDYTATEAPRGATTAGTVDTTIPGGDKRTSTGDRHHSGAGTAAAAGAAGAGAAGLAAHEAGKHHSTAGTHGTHGPGTTGDKVMDKVTPGTNTYGSTDPTHSGSAVTGQRGLPGSEGHHTGSHHGTGLAGAGMTGAHATRGTHGPGTATDRAIDKVTPGQNTYGSSDPMHSGSAVTGQRGLPGSEGSHHHSGAGTALGAGALGAGAGGLAAHQHHQGHQDHHTASQNATTKDKIMDKITPGTNTYGTTQPGVSPTHGSAGTHGTHGTHGPGTATDRAVDKVTPGTNTYGSTDPMHSGSAVTGQRGLPGSEGRHGPTTGATGGMMGSHGTHGPGTATDRAIDKVTPGQNTYGSTDPMHSGSAVTGQRGLPGSEGSHHHSGAGTALGAGALGAGAGGLAGHQYGQHHGTHSAGMTGTHGPGTTTDRMMDKVTPGTNTYGSTDPMHSGSAVTGKHGLPGSEGKSATGMMGTGSGLTGTHGTGMTGTHGPGTTTDKMMDKVTPGQNTYGSTDPMHSGSAVTGKHGLPGSEGKSVMGGGMTGTHGPGTTTDKMMDKVTPGSNTYGSTDPLHTGSAVTGQHGLPGSEGRSVTGAGAGLMSSQSHHQGTTSDRMMDKVTPGTNTYGTTQDPAMVQHDKIMPGGSHTGTSHHTNTTGHSTGSSGGFMQKVKDKVEDVVGGHSGTGHHNTGAHPTAVGHGANPTGTTGTTGTRFP